MEQNMIISIVAAVVIAGLVSASVASFLVGDISSVEQKAMSAISKASAVESKLAEAQKQAGAAQAKASAVETKLAELAPSPRAREFVVTGVELKGTTSTDSLAVPSVDPTTLSDGYRYKAPGFTDDPTKWQVASYIWESGPMVAYTGDTVSLVVFIINGDEHESFIEDPDGAEIVDQVMNRGREYKLSFKAEKSGLYQLICSTHEPTMKTAVLVLPRA